MHSRRPHLPLIRSRLLAVALTLLALTVGVGAETLSDSEAGQPVCYLRSRRAPLRAEPLMRAARKGLLLRGARLVVLEHRDQWLRVREANLSPPRLSPLDGWVPEAYVTLRPLPLPLTAGISLPRLIPSTVMSHGVVAPAPPSGGADFAALEAIEKLRITPQELDNFRSSAKLVSE